jgi:hypothetical protein
MKSACAPINHWMHIEYVHIHNGANYAVWMKSDRAANHSGEWNNWDSERPMLHVFSHIQNLDKNIIKIRGRIW